MCGEASLDRARSAMPAVARPHRVSNARHEQAVYSAAGSRGRLASTANGSGQAATAARSGRDVMQRAEFRLLAAGALLVAALGVQPTARADGASGVYVGGSAGRARNDYDTTLFESQLMTLAGNGGQTLTFSESVLRKRSNAWWAYVGDMRWSYIGIEALYLHLGELTYWSAGTLQPPTQALAETTTVRSRGPAVALRFRIPVAEGFDLDLRIGDYYGKTTLFNVYEINSVVTPQTRSTTGSSLLLGLGAGYTFGGHWSARLDYLRINQSGDSATVGKYSVDLATAGLSYTF
jgi:hypothetical protein